MGVIIFGVALLAATLTVMYLFTWLVRKVKEFMREEEES